MLILEGPDGSGKSTLANTLLDEFQGLTLVPKAVNSDSEFITDVRKWTDEALAAGFGPRMYDRFGLISEYIYGPAWRGEVRDPYGQMRWVGNAFARLHVVRPIVIICLPPFETVVRNIRIDPQNEGLYFGTRAEPTQERRRKGVGRIYWQYFGLAASRLDYAMYDYTVEGAYDSLVAYINEVIENREQVAAWKPTG